jgi:hypothetical protein
MRGAKIPGALPGFLETPGLRRQFEETYFTIKQHGRSASAIGLVDVLPLLLRAPLLPFVLVGCSTQHPRQGIAVFLLLLYFLLLLENITHE